MTPQIPNESEDTLVLCNALSEKPPEPDYTYEGFPLDFLEAPTISLVTKDISQMSQEEVASLLSQLRDLNQKPGALTRALKDESALLDIRTKRVSRGPAIKKTKSHLDALV